MFLKEIADVISLSQERGKRTAQRIADKMLTKNKKSLNAEVVATEELETVHEYINQQFFDKTKIPGFESFAELMYWLEIEYDSNSQEHVQKRQMVTHHAGRIIRYIEKAIVLYQQYIDRWKQWAKDNNTTVPEIAQETEYIIDILKQDIATLQQIQRGE